MRKSKVAATAVLVSGFAVSYSAWAPPGGNNGKGGQGGGESALRLCADFSGSPSPYINSDGNFSDISPFQYCDGYDGEILTDEGLKLSTTTRNTATPDRTVEVNFTSTGTCAITETPVSNPLIVPGGEVGVTGRYFPANWDAFFGWQKQEYEPVAACPDPFDGDFDPANPDDMLALERCLPDTPNGQDIVVGDLTHADGTKFMSWRVNLTDPTASKKDGVGLVMVFGGAFGPHECPIPHGLPVAIQCTGPTTGQCTSWRVQAFRACVLDYKPEQGGNWNPAYKGCAINTDITFSVKP